MLRRRTSRVSKQTAQSPEGGLRTVLLAPSAPSAWWPLRCRSAAAYASRTLSSASTSGASPWLPRERSPLSTASTSEASRPRCQTSGSVDGSLSTRSMTNSWQRGGADRTCSSGVCVCYSSSSSRCGGSGQRSMTHKGQTCSALLTQTPIPPADGDCHPHALPASSLGMRHTRCLQTLPLAASGQLQRGLRSTATSYTLPVAPRTLKWYAPPPGIPGAVSCLKSSKKRRWADPAVPDVAVVLYSAACRMSAAWLLQLVVQGGRPCMQAREAPTAGPCPPTNSARARAYAIGSSVHAESFVRLCDAHHDYVGGGSLLSPCQEEAGRGAAAPRTHLAELAGCAAAQRC